MKTLIKIWLLALSITLYAGGDSVGGGGIAENNILYSFLNLESFIELCVNASVGCGITVEEGRLLRQISDSMKEERKNTKLIRFESESQKPGFFYVDGALRIAKTGFHVGDPIYFNVDMLYPLAGTVSIPLIPPPDRPLDIPIATGLLVHELGHHQGEKDHTALDLLAGKVQTFMRVYSSELDGGPLRKYIIATALEFGKGSESDLVLRDKRDAYSLLPQLRKTLKCDDKSQPGGFTLWNMHWLRETRSEGEIVLPLRARVLLYCKGEFRVESKELEIEIVLEQKSSGPLSILNPKTKMAQIDCETANEMCH